MSHTTNFKLNELQPLNFSFTGTGSSKMLFLNHVQLSIQTLNLLNYQGIYMQTTGFKLNLMIFELFKWQLRLTRQWINEEYFELEYEVCRFLTFSLKYQLYGLD